MIAKESHAIAIKGLRQERSLHDQDDTVEAVCGLNPEFQDLIPWALGPADAGPWTFKLISSPAMQRQTPSGGAGETGEAGALCPQTAILQEQAPGGDLDESGKVVPVDMVSYS
jgi:hypothetical protein